MHRRSVMVVGVLLCSVPGLARAQRAAASGRSGGAASAPVFVVDPMWPKPMPNRWILGSTTGVAVDAENHVLVVHLTNSFNTRTEIGLVTTPQTGECCAPAPNVLEFDPAGTLVAHWGGPG